MAGNTEQMIDMILAEYRRIMNTSFWVRDEELRKFNIKINTMKECGVISAHEFEEIKYSIKMQDLVDMENSMQEIMTAMKKC